MGNKKAIMQGVRAVRLPNDIYNLARNMIMDDVTNAVEGWLLDSYGGLKTRLKKLNPTLKEYKYLKKDSNWALYDSYDSYPKEYLAMVFDAAEDAWQPGRSMEDFEIELLEDYRFQNASSNIAVDILETAIKSMRKAKDEVIKNGKRRISKGCGKRD